MYTFIIIAIAFFVMLMFGIGLADFSLINKIKVAREYNKLIKEKIKNGERKSGWYDRELYSSKDYESYIEPIINFIGWNFLCDFAAFVFILFSTFIVLAFCPTKETNYYFNINSLKDNLVTEGEVGGSMFGMRGYVDGELSYFFSRTYYGKGEKIGHIPADKTYVQYNNEEKPKITVYQEEYIVNELLGKFIFDEFINDPVTVRYIITVPEGTIETTGTYSIDME